MPSIELPHTAGCVVCGPANAKGLRLRLFVDPQTGVVSTEFTPDDPHIGFIAITHGGIVATVLDEVMVWAASWSNHRFCVCAEMNVRFRRKARLREPLKFAARVESSRAKLILTSATAKDNFGNLIAEATGKYMPLSAAENRQFVATFVADPGTAKAAEQMQKKA
jgi:acyl-coenzyme A thioesterase PaaI-like protein